MNAPVAISRALPAKATGEPAAGGGSAAARWLRWRQPARMQLVYGEFDPDFFARLLEAAGVEQDDELWR